MRLSPLLVVVAVAGVVGVACRAPTPEDENAEGANAAVSEVRSGEGGVAVEVDPTCPKKDEIAFSKEQGCANDGSVEFCLPKDDAEAVAQVLAVAPGVHCTTRSGGRANCDRETSRLCFYPTNGRTCVPGTRAMNDTTWGEVCKLAELEKVTRIVHTFFD